MSSSTRGVAPMRPIEPGGVTPDPGRATIDRRPLRPRIPSRWWDGVQPGAMTTAANTPAGAAPGPEPIPGAAPSTPGGSCCA